MSKFKIGDRVKSLDINAPELGYMAGTIIGKDEGNNWEISWDKTPYGRINWHDEQLAHLTPTSPVREVTKREIVDGTYSRVFVYKLSSYLPKKVAVAFVKSGEEGHVDTPAFVLDATELRAAAAVLLELAGALE